MKMARDNTDEGNAIQRYEPGNVRIREQNFSRSLIVLPDRLLPDWEPNEPQQLRATDLQPIVDCHPEVLILGTGERQVFPEPAAFVGLMELGIGCEIMDNAAACRTFNILLAEGRRAALALLLGGE